VRNKGKLQKSIEQTVYLIKLCLGTKTNTPKQKPDNKGHKTKKKPHNEGFMCGTSRDRTSDTRIFSPLLYQLSYGTSVFGAAKVTHILNFLKFFQSFQNYSSLSITLPPNFVL
jgi:hypothetical protein